MKVLHLTLKKKWFDKTESGEKPEEYREITLYWIKRLCHVTMEPICDLEYEGIEYNLKKFDAVFARNGYNPKKNPCWTRKHLGTSIGYGQEKWGAEPGKQYFVIKLGERIS